MSGREFIGQAGFLQGGGEAGALLRARDWSATPLGAPAAWPQALKTLVGIVLGADQPMLIVWGPARTLVYNDAYALLCGNRHPAGFGGSFEAMWHDVWPQVEPIITRGFAGEPTHMDDLALVLTRNGYPEQAHFSFGYTPVRDETGVVAGLFCACTETTPQVRAAAEVREREERLRLVVQGAKDHAIVTTDPNGIITSWSAGAEAIFGWTTAEAVGRSCGILYTPQDLREDRERLALLAAARDGAFTDERWHLRKDGSRVYMNGSVQPLPVDAQGKRQGFLKIARDETARRRDAEALRVVQDRSHQILDGMDEGLIVLDPEFRVVEINREGLRIDGRPRDQIIGRTHADLYPKTVGMPVEYTYRRAMRERVPTSLVHRYVDDRSGRDLWLELRVFPTETGGVAGFYRDISERKRAEERMVLSEESLRLTTEAAEIGVWDLDLRTDTLTWSRRTREMFGIFSNRACTMADFYNALHPDHRDATSEAFAAALDSKVRASYDVVYRTIGAEDGIVRWVAAKGKAIFDESGFCLRALGTAIDVTEKRLIQRRQAFLLELMDRLRAEDDSRAMMQVAVDMLGRELGVSRVGYGLIDLAGARALLETEYVDGVVPLAGTYPLDTFGRGNVANLRAGRTSVYADVEADSGTAGLGLTSYGIAALIGVPLISERRLRAVLYINHARPRVWRPAEVSLAEEVAARIWGAVERARAQDELRLMNETLEQQVAARTRERDQIWQATTDLLCVATLDGHFLSLNPAWGDVLGWTDAELKAAPFLDFVHPEDHALTLEAAAALSAGDPTLAFENRYRRKDGNYRWFSWNAVPRDGLIYATVRDITVVKEQALALAATEEALRQSQKMEAVGQLTGGLAHDFNNLLTGIAGSLELLEIRVRQGRINDVTRYVQSAQGAAKRAAALTHRLLAFSRRQTLAPKPTDVNRLVSGMEDLIRRTVGPAIEIEVVGAADLWPALIDPNQLENALLNLCINARDAMPDGGRISIETANKSLDGRVAREHELDPGQYLSLCVTDTGTGMTPDVIAKVFDPFFTTKPLGEGTGLGLSMIYGFVRQSGGQVRVYSEVGQGTTMCLYLPRHYGAINEETEPAEGTVPRAEQGETVLVVDDEPTVRMLVTEILADLGYTAIEAADAAAGLRILNSDVRIDLLVTDVGLPGGMNGRQMADAARVVRPDLKVLFITGYAENAVIGDGRLDPGMEVLAKPFAIDDLAARMRAIIESGA